MWTQKKKRIVVTLLVIVLFIALACVFTRPLLLKGRTHTLKHESDPVFQAWLLNWDIRSLTRNPLNLFNANIFFPNSHTLAYSDHQVAIALQAIPILAATGNPIQTANYTLILQFFLCALGAYLLVAHLTKSHLAGVVAGIAYSYAPYKLSHIVHLVLCSACWIPLALLFLHKYSEDRKSRDAFLFALFLLLQMLTGWYYGIMLALAAVLFLLVRLISRRKTFTLKWTLVLLMAILLAVAMVVPFALPYFKVQKSESKFKRTTREIETFSADVTDFLTAPQESLLWGGVTRGLRNRMLGRGERNGPTERSIFPGLVPLILGIGGIAFLALRGKGEERFSLWFYLTLLLVSAALCMGNVLYLFGHKFNIPMPYHVFYYLFPGFRLMRVPPRFAILTALALAVLSGFAVKALITWASARRRAVCVAIMAALVAILLVDLMPVSLPLQRVPLKSEFPPVYSWLQRQPGQSPTAELPIPLLQNVNLWLKLDVMREYYSTLHWKKIVNGYSGYLPNSIYEASAASGEFPSEESLRFFRKNKVRYLIVHGAEIERSTVERAIELSRKNSDFSLVETFGRDLVFQLK